MLEFHRTDKFNQETFLPYYAHNNHISDFSVGFQFMWDEYLRTEYAFVGGCLIFKEFYAGKEYFHYPLSARGSEEDEEAAVGEIEAYCREHGTRLHFTNVPKRALMGLVLRYGREVSVTDNRRWRDYLYEAEDFKNYAGKRHSGQRNHVHKFEKTYRWEFSAYTPEDMPLVEAFFVKYGGMQHKKAYLAAEELQSAREILPRIGQLGLFGGLLFAEGELAACAFGERTSDMVVVHIEKALKTYEGAYPMIAREFARMFCGEGVRYINRMDDAGDRGLRKSKLQYVPAEIVDKYNVIPKRAIDGLSRLPVIKTERLTLAPVKEGDVGVYARLAGDVARNRYWGYDWRSDYPEGDPPPRYFYDSAREDFKRKQEAPLGIYRGKQLIGETVLHRFGYRDEVEIGVRLLPEAEGMGYAREAVRAYADHAFVKLGIERVEAKCFRENVRSAAMLLGAGMVPCGEDDTFLYFYKTAAM